MANCLKLSIVKEDTTISTVDEVDGYIVERESAQNASNITHSVVEMSKMNAE